MKVRHTNDWTKIKQGKSKSDNLVELVQLRKVLGETKSSIEAYLTYGEEEDCSLDNEIFQLNKFYPVQLKIRIEKLNEETSVADYSVRIGSMLEQILT